MKRIIPYSFFLEVRDIGTSLSRQEKIEDDTMALVIEDALFSALSEGKLPAGVKVDRAVIEPLWKEEGKSPYVTGLDVTISWEAPEDTEHLYKKRYDKSPFHPKAKQVVAELIKEDLTTADGDPSQEAVKDKKFLWMVTAFRESAAERDSPSKRFSAAVADCSFPVLRGSAAEFNLTLPVGEPQCSFSVFVGSDVIREIQQLTLETEGRLEQAGVLIGYLVQDGSTGRVFSIVTAQLGATANVHAEIDSFKFTAETFMDIHRRIQLRGCGEIILGWQHNHHYCAGCPSNPSGSTIFFSSADVKVQSAAFRAPYMVALVAGRDLDLEPTKPAARMFGWNSADVRPRGFIPCEWDGRVSVSGARPLLLATQEVRMQANVES